MLIWFRFQRTMGVDMVATASPKNPIRNVPMPATRAPHSPISRSTIRSRCLPSGSEPPSSIALCNMLATMARATAWPGSPISSGEESSTAPVGSSTTTRSRALSQ